MIIEIKLFSNNLTINISNTYMCCHLYIPIRNFNLKKSVNLNWSWAGRVSEQTLRVCAVRVSETLFVKWSILILFLPKMTKQMRMCILWRPVAARADIKVMQINSITFRKPKAYLMFWARTETGTKFNNCPRHTTYHCNTATLQFNCHTTYHCHAATLQFNCHTTYHFRVYISGL